MVLDVEKGQELFDTVTQSYGNLVEAEFVACLVQFINERAKVPFNRKLFLFNNINHFLFDEIQYEIIFNCKTP